MQKPYSLIPELVPGDLWGRSAYRMLGGRVAWKKKIRPDALAKAKDRCETCDAKEGQLTCHDKWSYDDKKAIATLVGFEIHCRACDSVTHFGRLLKMGASDEELWHLLLHICRTNKCEPRDADNILRDSYELWGKRNKKKWKVAVAPSLLTKYPELEGLPTFKPAVIEY